jgi:hypothetical protein
MRISHQSHTKLIAAIAVIIIIAGSVGYTISQFSNLPKSTPTPTPQYPRTFRTSSPSQTPSSFNAVFDFDIGSPAPKPYISTPFDQTCNGVTAHFSSPSDFPSRPAFSIQSRDSLVSMAPIINSTLFSGNFIYPNTVNRDKLDVKFNRNITSISLTFRTSEYNDPGKGGTGSTIRLTAYYDSSLNIVGAPITANGVEMAMDIYPEGTLRFNSGGLPFNLVEVDLPFSPQGATGFLIDNIQATG